MDVSHTWWREHCIGGGEDEDEEEAVEIDGKYLTNVVYVEVSPPWGRERSNPDCYIYGHISFNVGLSDEPVTLYRRHRDSPDLLRFTGDHPICCLHLTDGHEGERALGGVTKSNPLYLNMKLYEKKGSSEEEDELMANVENVKYYNSYHNKDYCSYLRVTSESEFDFLVCYTVVFGARAEVEVWIEKDEEEEEEERGSSGEVPMWGDIGAWQCLRETSPRFPDSVSETKLLKVCEREEATYIVDEPIELERRFVVAPMRYCKYLCITLKVVTDSETPGEDEDTVLENDFYFPLHLPDYFKEVYPFKSNKDLTYTKYVEHVPGTWFSVSIKFVRP